MTRSERKFSATPSRQPGARVWISGLAEPPFGEFCALSSKLYSVTHMVPRTQKNKKGTDGLARPAIDHTVCSVSTAEPSAISIRRRPARISVRVTSEQKQVIKQAAVIGRTSVSAFVLASVEAVARQIVEARHDRTPGSFDVLCRIDAFADYVAEVEAEDAEEAATLASDNHGDYKWEHRFTQEFDARLYVTLDEHGNEIEETQVGDF